MNSNVPLFAPKISSFDANDKKIVIEYLKCGHTSFFYRASTEIQSSMDVQAEFIKSKLSEYCNRNNENIELLEYDKQFDLILPTNFRNNLLSQELALKLVKKHTIDKLEKKALAYTASISAMNTKISAISNEMETYKHRNNNTLDQER